MAESNNKVNVGVFYLILIDETIRKTSEVRIDYRQEVVWYSNPGKCNMPHNIHLSQLKGITATEPELLEGEDYSAIVPDEGF